MSDESLAQTMAFTGIAAGDLLADRYELRARVGSGAMGVVWRALDRDLDEEVALKFLHPEGAGSPTAVVRFRREVKLARRVTHPNVARTYDLGKHGALRFFTMELITGESLGARMRSPLPLADALRIAAEVARGLAAAHAQTVVHRDLKPDNVMLAGGRVVITDFGIARADDDAMLTHQGALVGTPAYMAPEQLEDHGVDGRADVYALGVVLFEAVTGALPFHGETAFGMAAARLLAPPPDPRSLVPTVPDGVARLVLDALARQREDRPDAQTLAGRLDAIRGGGGGAPRGASFTTTGLAGVEHAPRGFSSGRAVRVAPIDAPAELGPLADDLTRALRDALGSERGVRVVTSEGDLVVSGELRAAGDRARARLRVASSSGAAVWSSRVEGALSDPFALEDAVTAEVRAAVRARVSPRRGPIDETLRSRWESACALLEELDPASSFAAITALEELALEAPSDASVQSLLARALTQFWLTSGSADPHLAARAEELALRAIDADPSLADAYLSITTVRMACGDYRAAVRAAREAVACGTTLGAAHHTLGKLLCTTGNAVEGLRRMELASRFGQRGSVAHGDVLHVRALLGETDRVRSELARVRGTPEMRSYLPLCIDLCVWWDDRALADETADVISEANRGAAWDSAVPLLRAFARGEGAYEAAVRVFREDPAVRPSSWHRAHLSRIAAGFFAYLGRAGEALDELERGVIEPTFVELLWLDRVPVLASLRSDPRFAAARALVAARVAESGL